MHVSLPLVIEYNRFIEIERSEKMHLIPKKNNIDDLQTEYDSLCLMEMSDKTTLDHIEHEVATLKMLYMDEDCLAYNAISESFAELRLSLRRQLTHISIDSHQKRKKILAFAVSKKEGITKEILDTISDLQKDSSGESDCNNEEIEKLEEKLLTLFPNASDQVSIIHLINEINMNHAKQMSLTSMISYVEALQIQKDDILIRNKRRVKLKQSLEKQYELQKRSKRC